MNPEPPAGTLLGHGLDDVPEPWLPSLARIAGSEDIPALVAAIAGLCHAAIPHELSVISCQFQTSVFDRYGLATDPDIVVQGGTISAHAVLKGKVDQPEAVSVDDMDFFSGRVGDRTVQYGLVFNVPYRGGFGATTLLYRTPAQGPFDLAAVAVARLLRPIFEQALDRLLEQQRTRALQKSLIGFLHDLPVGLILLDWDRTPIWVNREGYKQTLLWNHAPAAPPRNEDAKAAFRMPDDIHAASSDFLQRWQGSALMFGSSDGERRMTTTLQHPARPEMRASVTASHLPEDNAEPPKYLVRYYGLQTRTDTEFMPTPEQLQLLAQLTPTERTIAILVMQGLSNREISERLHREVSTVKDHLTHIFDKLSIRSRVQLARLLS